MDLQALVKQWESGEASPLTSENYLVRLPLEQAARLEALADLYPLKTREQIITELLEVVLDDLLRAFPYIPGSKVIATDELGDPVFEDIGRTPRFLALTKKHIDLLQGSNEES